VRTARSPRIVDLREQPETADETADDAPSNRARDVMGGPGRPSTHRPLRSRARGCLIEIAQIVLLTIVVFFVIQTFVAQPYEVQHESMRATLEEGQYVLVDKFTPHIDAYSRGDIVVFNPVRRETSCSGAAASLLPGPAPYIKRVIGEPGDLVQLRDGTVFVNGAVISEPYVRGLATGPLSSRDSWLVSPGRLFVMGDNREDSIDSRSDQLGEVCANDVIGRAFLRYWPLNRLGILQRPTYGGAQPASEVAPDVTTSPAATSPVNPTWVAEPGTALPSRSPPAAVERLQVEVIGRWPHDDTSYTQGLVMVGGRLYESSGYGASTLREVDLQTGAVLRSVAMDSQYFAEGIAVADDRLIQLTWQGHTAFVYRLSDLHEIATFTYDTEGWGLCDDGTRLVMSDGTSNLYFRNRSTFELLGTVTVTNEGAPIDRLNELECVDGHVFANVWQTDEIVRIDPSSGEVNAVIDASGLLAPDDAPGEEEAVLNGIAFNTSARTFLLTGKLWPWLFEVRFVPR
jgi:signal peptidase I